MLVLTRKPGESVTIGDQIKLTVIDIKGRQVRLGIEAPRNMTIHREEVYARIHDENQQAARLKEVSMDTLASLFAPRPEPKKGEDQ